MQFTREFAEPKNVDSSGDFPASIVQFRLRHVKSCFYHLIIVVASYVYFSFQKKCRSPGKPKKLKQRFTVVPFLTENCFVV